MSLWRAVYFWCGPLGLPWKAAALTALTILALLGLRHALPELTIPEREALLPLDWMLLLPAGTEVRHWMRASRSESGADGSPV